MPGRQLMESMQRHIRPCIALRLSGGLGVTTNPTKCFNQSRPRRHLYSRSAKTQMSSLLSRMKYREADALAQTTLDSHPDDGG